MEEKWSPVVGWESLYEVSSRGRVRSLDRVVKNYPDCTRVWRGRYLKATPSNAGYPIISMSNSGLVKNRMVHQLVAASFIPNTHNKPHINHKDGDKTNNNMENLEWCTHKENMQHGFATGLIPKRVNLKGEKSMAAKLTDFDVVEIKRRLSLGHTCASIERDYVVGESAIREISKGRSWSHIYLPSPNVPEEV